MRAIYYLIDLNRDGGIVTGTYEGSRTRNGEYIVPSAATNALEAAGPGFVLAVGQLFNGHNDGKPQPFFNRTTPLPALASK
jgi:hypothetical protein